jgi:phosphomannomutase/phosphoglucomutase
MTITAVEEQSVKSIFREYDIRGIVGDELNEWSVKRIGYFFGRRVAGERIVAVGYDARIHAPLLRDWLVSGLKASGCTVLDMGLVPTPVNYFSNYLPVRRMVPGESPLASLEEKPSASIMITGSHNPPEYNGFKITLECLPFFGGEIGGLGEEVLADDSLEIPDDPEAISVDLRSLYIDYMMEQFAHLRGMQTRIVYDCGNGAAGVILPEMFERLEIEATGLYVEPDGTFPHHHPDPSVEENLHDLKEAMRRLKADAAFAYDGDADRIAFLTPRRNIKGDEMALLFERGMEAPTIIGEVKCSQLMYDELRRRGATAVMYKTGHSNLKVKIREIEADLACEVSGHIFFADRYFGYDDAIYATFRILELLKMGIDPVAELEKLPRLYATEEIKIESGEGEKFAVIEELRRMLQHPPEGFLPIREIVEIDGLRVHFDEGWALVRASNTTPVLVTRYEAPDREQAERLRYSMESLIGKAMAMVSSE